MQTFLAEIRILPADKIFTRENDILCDVPCSISLVLVVYALCRPGSYWSDCFFCVCHTGPKCCNSYEERAPAGFNLDLQWVAMFWKWREGTVVVVQQWPQGGHNLFFFQMHCAPKSYFGRNTVHSLLRCAEFLGRNPLKLPMNWTCIGTKLEACSRDRFVHAVPACHGMIIRLFRRGARMTYLIIIVMKSYIANIVMFYFVVILKTRVRWIIVINAAAWGNILSTPIAFTVCNALTN